MARPSDLWATDKYSSDLWHKPASGRSPVFAGLTITGSASIATLHAGSGGGMTNPMTTAGDVIYGGAGGVATRLAKGSDGEALVLASGVPSWASVASDPDTSRVQVFIPWIGCDASIIYNRDTGGSGAISETTGAVRCATGDTNPSRARIQWRDRTMEAGGNFFDRNSEFSTGWYGAVVDTDAGDNGNVYMVVGFADGTYTNKMYGFHLDYDGATQTLYAYHADGTNVETTDISSGISIAVGAEHVFRAVFTAGVDIKFYVDGVLKATHTANLPSGAASSDIVLFCFEVDNDSTNGSHTHETAHTHIIYDAS